MMDAQVYADGFRTLAMVGGQAVKINRATGEFIVKSGRVWLTRPDDLDDHVIEAGQRVVLDHAGAVVLEPWHREGTVIAWRPHAGPRLLEALPRGATTSAL